MSLVKCVYCKGKGKVVCPECKGSKKKKKTCILCKGKGKITCTGCMGAGFVEMPTIA